LAAGIVRALFVGRSAAVVLPRVRRDEFGRIRARGLRSLHGRAIALRCVGLRVPVARLARVRRTLVAGLLALAALVSPPASTRAAATVLLRTPILVLAGAALHGRQHARLDRDRRELRARLGRLGFGSDVARRDFERSEGKFVPGFLGRVVVACHLVSASREALCGCVSSTSVECSVEIGSRDRRPSDARGS
jgi:hypothetical protein